MFKLLILTTSCVFACFPRLIDGIHPDAGLNITQFLTKYSYPYEIHQVETDDGYLLTVNRITNERFNYNSSKETKPVVFLVHGMLNSAMEFMNMGPDTALGLRLADEGYDVWFLNMRGSTLSRNHTNLDPDDKTSGFWDFSFHEIGYYDLPAAIDYILKSTKLNKLSYVGFSEGTTTFMVMASSRPEYNEKLNLAVTLAPVAYMQNVTHPITYILKSFPILSVILDIFNVQEMLSHRPIVGKISEIFCNEDSIFVGFCTLLISIIGGFDLKLFNESFIPVLSTNCPAGSSRKTFKHYLQFAYTEFFRQYDYGAPLNRKIYNSSVPPSYNISKISAPLYLVHAENDYFSSVPDVKRLIDELPNVVEAKLVEWKKFTHIDFLYANYLNKYVNNDVINVINKFNNKSN